MATEQNLASEISDYISRAQGLETTRQALVEKITGVVRTEIVPKISPLLPDGYSIDTDAISVHGVGGDPRPHGGHKTTHGIVPTGFSVDLVLLYGGKPATYHQSKSARTIVGVINIQRDLKPKLEELAEQYNLDRIIPMCEPGRI